MTHPLTMAPMLIAVISSVVLVACSKPHPETPAVAAAPVAAPASPGTAPAGTAGSSVDASVPTAASVLTPARDVKVDPNAGRSNQPMTRAQESTAMPLPGQNNDHSAPLPPAKGSSSP